MPGMLNTLDGERLICTFVTDSANGSVPQLSLPNLRGFFVQLIQNPNNGLLTDGWHTALFHPSFTTFDVLSSNPPAMTSGATPQIFQPAIINNTSSNGTLPIYLNGNYLIQILGNTTVNRTANVILDIVTV